jgi:hypothetical protein
VSRSALLYRMQKHGLAEPAHTDRTSFAQV